MSKSEQTLESESSIKRRISEVTGFKAKEIVLCEAGYSSGWCDRVSFVVRGKGFWCDFADWDREHVWDEERSA